MRLLLAAFGALLAAGCGGGGGGGDAGGPDAGAQDAGVQDAGAQDAGAQDAGAQDAGAQDAGGGTPSVTASDQTLSDLSTVVTVDEVVSSGPGWIVIHDASQSGDPGEVIGHAPVPDGASADVLVTLERPAVSGETLFAMLYVDAGAAGVFEVPGDDVPATDAEGNVVVTPFLVTVSDGTPAVRLTVTAIGIQQWNFTRVEPSLFADSTVGGASGNQTLTLEPGWRYEIVNLLPNVHPFEVIVDGGSPVADQVLLSQAVSGSLEGDASVDWSESAATGTVRFTVSAALMAEADGYRCAVHSQAMRGAIVYAPSL